MNIYYPRQYSLMFESMGFGDSSRFELYQLCDAGHSYMLLGHSEPQFLHDHQVMVVKVSQGPLSRSAEFRRRREI